MVTFHSILIVLKGIGRLVYIYACYCMCTCIKNICKWVYICYNNVWICIDVFIYIFRTLYISVHVHKCMHTLVCVYISVCTSNMCSLMYKCWCSLVCIIAHWWMWALVYVGINVCTLIHRCTSVFVHFCIYTGVCVHWGIYIRLYRPTLVYVLIGACVYWFICPLMYCTMYLYTILYKNKRIHGWFFE